MLRPWFRSCRILDANFREFIFPGTWVNKGKKKAGVPKGEPRLYPARCLSGRTIKTGQ